MGELRTMLLMTLALLSSIGSSAPEPAAEFTRKQDIVYDRKFGTALTMDLFEPKGPANGAAVIWVVSGGWFSSHDSINPNSGFAPIKGLIARGYRVCAVVHRSNPYWSMEDAISDVERAVRFVREKAAANGMTTMPIGIIGASAGGHLSLMAGTSGDDGDKLAKDPVARTSSRVQAVACYFPPTDFLNYGAPHINARETTLGAGFTAPFQFRRMNAQTKTVDLVTTPDLLLKILKDVSPISHVTADDAPTLILHGDADYLVPIQQSEAFVDRMKQAGVEAELVRRPGAGHGWATLGKDNELLFDWFDKHLLKK